MAVDIICPPIIFTGLRNLHLAGRMDIINNLTDKLLGKHETELSRAGPKHLCDVAPLYWSTMISFLGLIGSLTLKRPEIWQIPGPGILENDYASVLAGDQRSETFTKLSGRHSILRLHAFLLKKFLTGESQGMTEYLAISETFRGRTNVCIMLAWH
ncbi:hypothetical protein HZH66_002391 [Vespula vulgaris]|uniref:Uncharacterized protein n=1 Tax=Vespula vulgaris TaxID=7454 RepID=A0A834NHA7_VESVU|nr:hypothetical protein HZH66_002391 [Vespula vulgaris]